MGATEMGFDDTSSTARDRPLLASSPFPAERTLSKRARTAPGKAITQALLPQVPLICLQALPPLLKVIPILGNPASAFSFFPWKGPAKTYTLRGPPRTFPVKQTRTVTDDQAIKTGPRSGNRGL